jgi:hypothetical protein
MALVINDRVRETTTVTGTGSATLLGAVTGYQSFSVIGNGNTTYYTIADQGGPNWEVGLGTWSTGGTLARTTVLASSNSGSLVNFTTGTKDVFVTYPSENAIYNNGTSIVGPTGSSVAVANGGTGATTLAANGVIYGNGTGAVGVTAGGTTGQVLVGNTGAAPSFAALSSSAVTSITGTANQITASASTGAVTLSLPSSVTTGQYIANQSISGSVTQGAFAYGTLNGSDTGIFASYQTSIAGYAYMALQNTSSNAAATTDIALYNDTASLGKYIDIGINSSGFTGTGNFSLANAGYIYTNGGDLALGTYNANGIHFIVNNGATDAATVNGTTGVWTFASTITGSISGNAATATTATTATNATNIAITDNTSSASTYYPVLSLNSSGNNAATTSSTKLSFVPSTGTLTTSVISASTVSGTGFINYLASPPAIGGTAANTGTFTTIALGGNTQNQKLGAGDASIMKNRIINGAITISQYNGTSTVTPTNNQYTIDRWVTSNTAVASKYSVAQSTVAPTGFSNSLLITSLSAYTVGAAESFTVQQYIEGFNTADLGFGTANAKIVTLSFWVQSSLTGTFGGSIENSPQNRSYPFGYTITAANTWQQVSVTIAGDTTGTWVGATNGIGMQVRFSFGAGSSYQGTANAWVGSDIRTVTGQTSVVGTNGATFYITGVQLEVGSSATGFEYRQYQQELALCQRYYELYYNDSSGFGILNNNFSSNYRGVWYFKVEKRASPTVNLAGSSTWTNSTPTIVPSLSGVQITGASYSLSTGTANTPSVYASAEL